MDFMIMFFCGWNSYCSRNSYLAKHETREKMA